MLIYYLQITTESERDKMRVEIIQLDENTKTYLPHKQQPFDIIGRFIPIYDGEKWSYKEKLCNENRQKTYEDEVIDPNDYIENDEQAIFMALVENVCVGFIRISTCWFGNAYIEDVSIDASYRHLGIGRKLMDRTVKWCKEHKFSGIALETQDNNLQACRFYTKYGFELCGINTQKYALTKYKDETSLYFYYNLKKER